MYLLFRSSLSQWILLDSIEWICALCSLPLWKFPEQGIGYSRTKWELPQHPGGVELVPPTLRKHYGYWVGIRYVAGLQITPEELAKRCSHPVHPRLGRYPNVESWATRVLPVVQTVDNCLVNGIIPLADMPSIESHVKGITMMRYLP